MPLEYTFWTFSSLEDCITHRSKALIHYFIQSDVAKSTQGEFTTPVQLSVDILPVNFYNPRQNQEP